MEDETGYPDVIYATELVGSNGIKCLDYQNYENDVKYIRADLAQFQNTSSNSDYTKLAKWVHDCVSFGGTVEQVEDYLRKNFA